MTELCEACLSGAIYLTKNDMVIFLKKIEIDPSYRNERWDSDLLENIIFPLDIKLGYL